MTENTTGSANQADIMDRLKEVGIELEPELSEKISDVLTTIVKIIIDLRQRGIDLKFEAELGEKLASVIAVMNRMVDELKQQIEDLNKIGIVRNNLLNLALTMNTTITELNRSYSKIRHMISEKESIEKMYERTLTLTSNLLIKICEKYPQQLKECLTDLKITPEQFGKLIIQAD